MDREIMTWAEVRHSNDWVTQVPLTYNSYKQPQMPQSWSDYHYFPDDMQESASVLSGQKKKKKKKKKKGVEGSGREGGI